MFLNREQIVDCSINAREDFQDRRTSRRAAPVCDTAQVATFAPWRLSRNLPKKGGNF